MKTLTLVGEEQKDRYAACEREWTENLNNFQIFARNSKKIENYMAEIYFELSIVFIVLFYLGHCVETS